MPGPHLACACCLHPSPDRPKRSTKGEHYSCKVWISTDTQPFGDAGLRLKVCHPSPLGQAPGTVVELLDDFIPIVYWFRPAEIPLATFELIELFLINRWDSVSGITLTPSRSRTRRHARCMFILSDCADDMQKCRTLNLIPAITIKVFAKRLGR
jgi:hypothetical protein